MDFEATRARLRRTFAYPSDATTPSTSDAHDDDSDSDGGGGGPALDEQEQEELIRSLAEQNASRDAQFRAFLLAVPALSAVPYLALLIGCLGSVITSASPPRHDQSRTGGGGGRCGPIDSWTAILALSSLASTAWSLYSLPPGVTGIRVLDQWAASPSSSTTPISNRSTTSASTVKGGGYNYHESTVGNTEYNDDNNTLPLRTRHQRLSSGVIGPSTTSASALSLPFWSQHHHSPLEQYLPFLNIGLCAVLALTGFLSSLSASPARHHQQYWGHVGLAYLPAVVYAVILAAKMVMAGVDPEKELAALRYEYKGA